MGYAVSYYGDPVNQFNRLIRTSGPKGTGTYVKGTGWDNHHYDPSAGHATDYDNRNCTAAVGATLRDVHTGGRSKTTPNAMRNNQGDFDGGIGWPDINASWEKLFSEQLTIPAAYDWNDVMSALKGRRAVGVSGDYDQIPYKYQAQKGGTFDHAFSLHDYRGTDHRVLLWDPLGTHMIWVPQYVIRDAAEKLAMSQRGTKSRLFVALTRAIPKPINPATTWTAVVRPVGNAAKRTYWQYYLQGDYIIKRTGRETGGFSAGCSAPVWRRVHSSVRHKFPESGYWLVRINEPSSAYHGRWIAAGYARED